MRNEQLRKNYIFIPLNPYVSPSPLAGEGKRVRGMAVKRTSIIANC